MDSVRIPVEDGSSLVLVGLAPDPDDDLDLPDEAPILGGVTDFLEELAINGPLYGTAGALTFETLKALGRKLRGAGVLAAHPDPSMSDIQAAVRTALTDAGHPAPVVFTTTTQRPGDGWDVAGTAAGTSFTARTDPTGQVVHLQTV